MTTSVVKSLTHYWATEVATTSDVGGTGAGKVVARYPAEAVLETKAPAQWIMWLILIIFDVAVCAAIPILLWSMSQ